MSLPTSQPLPGDDDAALPPARRRRQRRTLGPDAPPAVEELAQSLIPSADFFLFSGLAGIALGLGILLNAPALYVLAALLAPFLTPAVGLGLATAAGSVRFLLQCLGGIGIGGGLVWGAGLAAGWIARLFPQLSFDQARLHAGFTWPDLAVLTLGITITTLLLVRSARQRSLPASAAVAYELYLPLGVAGFGLGRGDMGLAVGGLMVFAVHLAWTALLGMLLLVLRGMRPRNVFGYTVGTTLVMAGIAGVVVLLGVGATLRGGLSAPPSPAVLESSLTPSPSPTATLTLTPGPVMPTLTPTNTLVPSRTPTLTLSPVPTPLYARINARGSDGAVIRAEPDQTSPVVKTLLNGMLVEVTERVVQKGTSLWVYVRTEDGVEGWILRSLLATATPVPGW